MSSLVGAGIATAKGAARPTLLKPMLATGCASAVPPNSATTPMAAAHGQTEAGESVRALVRDIGLLHWRAAQHCAPDAHPRVTSDVPDARERAPAKTQQ